MSRFLSLAIAGLIVPVSTAIAQDAPEKTMEEESMEESEMTEGEAPEGEMAEKAMMEEEEEVKTNTIVDVAAGNPSFSTLVKAVQAAGLVDTLMGEGPFTVFAPTDEAFAAIDAEDLNALLADKAELTKVLTYHVLPGKVMASDVTSGKVATVEGSEVKIKVKGNGDVKVGKAMVTATDVVADNGVIHVIDTVIMP